jgi:hypothetical protein
VQVASVMMIEASVLLMVLANAAPSAPVSLAEARVAPPRTDHPFVIRADVGWNSLAGLGLRGSWAATDRLMLDVGAGYVLAGPKAGARLRWNFTTAALTPYAALGAIVSRGHADAQTIKQDDGDQFQFHVGPADYAQAVAGLDFQDQDRISYSVEVGWAQALSHRDVHVISGKPSDADWREVHLATDGGLVVGGSIGYAF